MFKTNQVKFKVQTFQIQGSKHIAA